MTTHHDEGHGSRLVLLMLRMVLLVLLLPLLMLLVLGWIASSYASASSSAICRSTTPRRKG